MYGKKIKFYRLKNKMTIADLAKKLGCTSAAISQYENDRRKPDMEMLNKMSEIFGVTPLDFLPNSISMSFDHCGYRVNRHTSNSDKQAFLCDIEDRCSKQVELLDILGILPERGFKADKLNIDSNPKEAAELIRKRLGVTKYGPILSIAEALEKLNIILLSFNAGETIEGCNGTVNGFIYIFFNSERTIERQRFTMIHEFVHLFFNHLKVDDTKELEKLVDKIAGMILIPDEDIYEKFGYAYRNITKPFMDSVAKEFMIAPSCLVRRLRDLEIVNELYYRNFHRFLSNRVGSRKNEPSQFKDRHEKPIKFEQMVYRAFEDELITISRASELLQEPIIDVKNKARGYC